MARKPRSDSIHQLVIDNAEPDTSAAPLPKLAGMESLDEVGLTFFADVYRAEVARWTTADLSMLVQASACHQRMVANLEIQAEADPIVQLSNGSFAKNPIYNLQETLSNQLRSYLRDLNVRSKDGAKPAAAPVKTAPTAGKKGEGFAAYLEGLRRE